MSIILEIIKLAMIFGIIYMWICLKNKENIKRLEIGPGHGRNIKFFKQYNNKFK